MSIGAFTTTILVICVISIALGAFFYFRCVSLECEVDVVQESKDALRESMSKTNYYLHQQLERVKGENEALRTQLHQLRKEQQKQGNQIHKAMTKEQKERLRAWSLNLLVTYRIDFFRGEVLSRVVNFLSMGDPDRMKKAIEDCRKIFDIGFEPDQKDYTELLRELRQIAKEVPLSDTAQSAITYVFGGEWEEAIEALDKLKGERNEQN
jgi:hypothetical protein